MKSEYGALLTVCCLCVVSLFLFTPNLRKISIEQQDKLPLKFRAYPCPANNTSNNSTDTLGTRPNVSVSHVKAPENVTIKVNVQQMCNKICDRDRLSCVSPNVAILVYNNSFPDRMTFKQSFSSFPVSVMKTESGDKNGTHVWSQKRQLCPITDLDPSFQIVQKQNSCAIIGNSGILLNGSCGTEINSHDFVIRANMAKLEGYTNDVGNKTSLMFINGQSLRDIYDTLFAKRNSSKSNIEVLLNYFKNLNDGIIWYGKGTLPNGYDGKLAEIAKFLGERLKVRFGFSMYEAGKLASRRLKTRRFPSSGLISLTVAESFCKHITLYGFYPYQKDANGSRILHHYYEPNLIDFHSNNHNFEEEHQLLRSLNKKGSVQLVLTPCKKMP